MASQASQHTGQQTGEANQARTDESNDHILTGAQAYCDCSQGPCVCTCETCGCDPCACLCETCGCDPCRCPCETCGCVLCICNDLDAGDILALTQPIPPDYFCARNFGSQDDASQPNETMIIPPSQNQVRPRETTSAQAPNPLSGIADATSRRAPLAQLSSASLDRIVAPHPPRGKRATPGKVPCQF